MRECSTRLLACPNVGDAPFHASGWGALLEVEALTAAGLERRRMALARPAPLHATKARDVERPLEKAWWCALCRHAPISSSAFPSSFSACGSVVLCHRLPLPTACQTVVRKTGNCFTRYGSTQTLVQGRARRSRLLPCPQNQFKRRSLQLVVGTTSSRDQDIQFKAPRGYITMWQCLPDTPVVVAVFNASPAVGRHLQPAL